MKPENPPAFPVVHTEGMTLRDWFAGQAVAAIIKQNCENVAHGSKPLSPREVASDVYGYADAMLEERSK